MILACEQHVDWIADCGQYLRDHGFSCIEAEKAAEDTWVQHNNEVADRTLYPFRGNPAYSCRMSAASQHTRRNATRSRPGATKAFVWRIAWNSSGLRQINDVDAFASRPLVEGNWPPHPLRPDRSSAELPRLQIVTTQMAVSAYPAFGNSLRQPFRIELVGKSAMTTD